MVRKLTSAVVLAALLPVPAIAKPPLVLKPSSKWNMHYAEDSCRMLRSFGEGDQMVTLMMDRFEPSDFQRLSFIGKLTDTVNNWGKAYVRFGPDEAVQEVPFYPGSASNKLPALLVQIGTRIAERPESEYAAYDEAVKAGTEGDFAWSTITPEREAAVTFIEVGRPVRKPFILETGSLAGPFDALRKCTDELLDHWGIDVAKHAALSRRATPTSSPSQWIKSKDYPTQMLVEGRRAIVQFRLIIDPAGSPISCHIQQSTRPKDFDDAVCGAVMRNAKFLPALDADGTPIKSYWLSAVVFKI